MSDQNNPVPSPPLRKLLGLERQQMIMEILRENKSVEVSYLSNVFNVSEVTIRKDLEKLERDGLLIRTHGGAVINENLLFEPSFQEKEDQFIEEKMAIASEAAKLIRDGMTISLTAGTTTSHIAKKIKQMKQITVVTNAINIATELMAVSGIKVFLTGGTIRPNSYALVGSLAEKSLSGIFVDLAFVGVNGFSINHGLTTPNIEEARVNRLLMKAANQVAVVADHSKFNKVTFSQIATVSEISIVITDQKAPLDQINQIKKMGKKVIIAQ